MDNTTPTAPAQPDAAKVPVASPQSSKPDAPLPVPAPTAPTPAVSDKSAPSAPPNADTPANDTGERKSSVADRIARLTAEKRELEARAIMAERESKRALEAFRELTQVDPLTLPPEKATAFEVQKAVRHDRAQAAQQAAMDAAEQATIVRAAQFQAKVEAAADRFPNLYNDFSRVRLSEVMAETVAESDRAVELAAWLSSNPREAERIYSLPPHKQGVEIARIESRVQPAAQMRRVSQAPAPVPTLSGAAPSPAIKDPVDMSTSEYFAWRKAGGGNR